MRLPVTTLRPDKYGYTNISRNVIQGSEFRNVPIVGSATTNSNHVTGGRVPSISREKQTDGGNGTPRTGPIVLPFIRNLYGRGQGAFCGDSSVVPVLGAEGFIVGSAVGIDNFDESLGISKIDLSTNIFKDSDPLKKDMLEDTGGGIIQSVIEDSARRTYLGIEGGTDWIYLLQFFGLARALVKTITDPLPVVRSKLYLETATVEGGIGLSAVEGDYFKAINLGYPLTSTVEGYTLNLVFLVQIGGINAKGDKALYKGVFLREYDEDGVIVAPGDEINPADYATQELYEAALKTAKHTLKPTWDYTRAHG